MFVSAKIYAELVAERVKNDGLTHALAQAEMSVEWLKLRVNQLEKERAILFREVTSLPIPVPEIVANPIPTSADHILSRGGNLWAGTDDGSVTN